MRSKAFSKIICAVLTFALMASMMLAGFQIFAAGAQAQPTANGTGYITDDYVNLRSGAGTGYSVVTVMGSSTKLTFTDGKLYNGSWYQVKLNGTSKTGYVHKDYVRTDEAQSTTAQAASSSTGYINADYVNLRKGAGTGYAIVTTMRINTKFTFVNPNPVNNWYQIKLSNGTTGYVISDYVTKDNNAQPATDPAPTEKPTQATEPVKPSEPSVTAKTGYINADYVNLRKGAGTGYAIVTTMRQNTKFTLVKDTLVNNWYNIKLSNGTTGYVIRDYATLDKTSGNSSATDPTTATTPASSGTVKLSASSQTVYTGNQFAITATGASSVKWTSSDSSVAAVDSHGVVTAKSPGTATVKAASSDSSATCKITVKSGSSVSISQTSIANMRRGKSVLLESYTGYVSWKSSNNAIATVSDSGVVDTKSNGYVTITAYTSGGAATCLIQVVGRDNIRFAYASPNSAPKNSTVTFKAITDKDRVAVRFVVSNGTKSYTVDATEKQAEGDTYVWSGSAKLDSPGKWNVKAYSKYKTSNSFLTTSGNGEAEVFVTNSTDTKTTMTGERRASDAVIKIISEFEGFLPDIIPDPITGDPTIGHGKVINTNEQFYNHLTRSEAYAYLAQTVNEGGYTTRTNAFLTQNNVKFNQNQFDALVCFAYNVGAYALTNDSLLSGVLLGASGSSGTVKAGAGGFVNASYVNLRSGAGTGYSVVTTMDYNTKFTFTDGKLYNSAWYKIKLSNGKQGYIYSVYASANGSGIDLNNIDSATFTNRLLQYHHASGDCWWGLLYRRIDEVEMFLYGDYELDGSSNKYGLQYQCYSYSRIGIS